MSPYPEKSNTGIQVNYMVKSVVTRRLRPFIYQYEWSTPDMINFQFCIFACAADNANGCTAICRMAEVD